MSQTEEFGEEGIDRSLAIGGPIEGRERLRAAVFAQTISVIRRRRRLKQCLRVAILVGFYLAGMATAGLWRSGKALPPRSPTEQAAASRAAVPADNQQFQGEFPRPHPSRYVGAARRHFASAVARGARQNADRELLEYGDVASAVAGYRSILDVASAKQLMVSEENDTWLLMALKNAKFKELRHERLHD